MRSCISQQQYRIRAFAVIQVAASPVLMHLSRPLELNERLFRTKSQIRYSELSRQYQRALKWRQRETAQEHGIKALSQTVATPATKFSSSSGDKYHRWARGASACRYLLQYAECRNELKERIKEISMFFGILEAVFHRMCTEATNHQLLLPFQDKLKSMLTLLLWRSMSRDDKAYLRRVAYMEISTEEKTAVPDIVALHKFLREVASHRDNERDDDKLAASDDSGDAWFRRLQPVLKSRKETVKKTGVKPLLKLINLLDEKKLWPWAEAIFSDSPVFSTISGVFESIEQTVVQESELLAGGITVLKKLARVWNADLTDLETNADDERDVLQDEVKYRVPPQAWTFFKAHVLGHLKGALSQDNLAALSGLGIPEVTSFVSLVQEPMAKLHYEWERLFTTGFALNRAAKDLI
eukprot:Gregarina_sp_Poly_1__3991@NODE_2201_length_2493_cov_30_230008_g1418_i0_p1_GENE_NODE_2201_length_2493_cov_30_230008_g1418_i0NODE_2201_length_2493_cov_30_230008_g1418_i0_p1_ORF_typecomplete_len410_score48_29DUF4381/PF14316_6/2_8e03DUF4381/PF14316_6/0_024_NODE_2201_length_2493_cov_30_230008_g1418_i01621391